MSRFDVPAHVPYLTVAVGWDGPMQTFLAQVERVQPRDDEHDPLHWVGKEYREITDPRQLNKLLVPFATLTEEHIKQLEQDRAESDFAEALQFTAESGVR